MSSASFENFLASIESPSLRVVASHWSAVRGTRRMPAWRDIDPAAIAPYLPIVWSWKYDNASDTMTGRLAGEEIIALFGRSLRGVPMSQFFSGHNYQAIFARHRRVAVEPALMRSAGIVFSLFGRSGVGERIVMPLADDGEHGDGIIGATVYQWVPASRPEAPSGLEPPRDAEVFFPLD